MKEACKNVNKQKVLAKPCRHCSAGCRGQSSLYAKRFGGEAFFLRRDASGKKYRTLVYFVKSYSYFFLGGRGYFAMNVVCGERGKASRSHWTLLS